MRDFLYRFLVRIVVLGLATSAPAQKIEIGYDKSVNFSQFKTYTLAEPAMPVTRPLLYAIVVGTIQSELNSKGLKRIDQSGDLILTAAGGVEFGLTFSGGPPISPSFSGPPATMNATMCTGVEGHGAMMPTVPDATLQLEFVDRSTNQIVWVGLVTQTLDIDQKSNSLALASKAVSKLLRQFPPRHSSK